MHIKMIIYIFYNGSNAQFFVTLLLNFLVFTLYTSEFVIFRARLLYVDFTYLKKLNEVNREYPEKYEENFKNILNKRKIMKGKNDEKTMASPGSP